MRQLKSDTFGSPEIKKYEPEIRGIVSVFYVCPGFRDVCIDAPLVSVVRVFTHHPGIFIREATRQGKIKSPGH